MDINWLVQRLKHGESYVVNDGVGDPFQVNNPPTALSIKAARVIELLNQNLNSASETNLNLQRQLNNLIQDYELLRQTVITPATSGEAGQ